MPKALHDKWRPESYDEVVGQAPIVKSLRGIIQRRDVHCFLFCGPSGVGKTTLARITAKELGCTDVREISAAVYNGVDDMRQIEQTMQYLPFGAKSRALIMDECHRLSKQAWDALLKVTEEPPEHVFWFFCTTEVDKIPKTIKTRCMSYTLALVSNERLDRLCLKVADQEGIKVSDGVVQAIVRKAGGSPRQLLVNLNKAREAKTAKEANRLLDIADEKDPPILELCRYVISAKGSWGKAMSLVDKLDGQSAESIRIAICNYLAVVIKNAETDEEAGRLLEILQNFASPYYGAENLAPLLLSIGQTLFSGEPV